MPIRAGEGKQAVAFFADGLELKFIRLSAKGGRVILRDFRSLALVKKLEETVETVSEGEGSASFDEMTSPVSTTEMLVTAEGGDTNASVVLGLLNDLGSARNYTISYAISEPAVTYQEFESDFGLKAERLKKKLSEELAQMRASAPAIDAINTISTASEGLLTIIREDGLNIYELLSEARSFIGGKMPKVKLVNSSDIALMECVRTQYELQPEEVSVIVYVGHDFSRIIFMQGENYLHFAPIISEGYESPNIENTIYSRILLEQDNIALTRIDRILLAGECHKINFLDTVAPQFSSALVEYIKAPYLDLGEIESFTGEMVSEYIIPIMIAWHALQPKLPGFYEVNLIPQSIIESQKVLTLAWHGVLAALLLMVTIPFFILSITERTNEIRKQKMELEQKKERLNELEIFRQRKANLLADINRYNKATAVYDSIAPGSDKWSRILNYIANSVEDLNSLWIYNLRPEGNSILISGRAIYRARIPRIASAFESATLREVRTTTVRKKVLYEFEMLVDKVDKYD